MVKEIVTAKDIAQAKVAYQEAMNNVTVEMLPFVNERLTGTLESELKYLSTHWLWGQYSAEAIELMAYQNVTIRLEALMNGTLGLRD